MSAHTPGPAEMGLAFSIVDRAMRRWVAARGAVMARGADWRVGDTGLLVRALRDEVAGDPVIANAMGMVALLREIADEGSGWGESVSAAKARALLARLGETR